MCKKDKTKPQEDDGTFINLDFAMSQSLLQTAIELSTEVCIQERSAIKRQREKKREKEDMLRSKRLLNATKTYIDKLYYRDKYDSPACWKTPRIIDTELKKLKSDTARREELKEQIRIRWLGLGWIDCQHAWSSKGVDYSAKVLTDHLKDIIKKHRKRQVPAKPPVDLPVRKVLPLLGMVTADVLRMDANRAAEEKKLMDKAETMRDELEKSGFGDRYAEMQQRSAPKVNEALVGQRIEVLCDFEEEDGKHILVWCQGDVSGVPEVIIRDPKKSKKQRRGVKKTKTVTQRKENNNVILTWDKKYTREDEVNPTIQTLLISKWNRHTEGSWRFVLNDK